MHRFLLILFALLIYVVLFSAQAKPRRGYVKFSESIEYAHLALPASALQVNDLPVNWDWRNVNGTNFCSRTINQKNPAVCGSCWAFALTGALTDRYIYMTGGRLQVQLAPQNLLNFQEKISGGTCNGGDPVKGYHFIHKYGITDDTCTPYKGLNWVHGFEVADMVEKHDVSTHQCYSCDWKGSCGFLPGSSFNIYGVDGFGVVLGEAEMMAEIYNRGPIACSINSDAEKFDSYRGGIIHNVSEKENKVTDHVVVVAGYGVDPATGMKFWVGRNSYGGQWGEGAGGGWFRLQRGVNALGMEANECAWAVPKSEHVARAISQWKESVAGVNV